MPLQKPLTKDELLTIASRLGFTTVDTLLTLSLHPTSEQTENATPPVIYTHPDSTRFFNESEVLAYLNSDKLFVHLLNELAININWVTDATIECYAVIIEVTVNSSHGYHDAVLRTILETTSEEELSTISFIEP